MLRKRMEKIAIIGASYLQAPLIEKAKAMGYETHVFAWAANDVGEEIADIFYPISIVEKEQILNKCRELQISGICSIGSDLAIQTVNYVADAMGLTANSMQSTAVSTNKRLMRERFRLCGDPSPKSVMVANYDEASALALSYPVIVKPQDRSGSRGITKVCGPEGLAEAVAHAQAEGFDSRVLIEEYAEGDEYSVEYISWEGEHHFLALTRKYTTGAPFFIETGHLQPAGVSQAVLEKIRQVVTHALDSLEIRYGASHSELKIDSEGNIRIIEIGARMGGDFIGSHLVRLSTGYDFVRGVIEVAMGIKPEIVCGPRYEAAAVRYILNTADYQALKRLADTGKMHIVQSNLNNRPGCAVSDSASRWGYLLAAFDRREDAEGFMVN